MALRVIFLALLTTFLGFAQRPRTELTFGGSGDDSITNAAVDSAGNIYVVGTAFSFDLPLRNAYQAANSGTQLIYSTDAGNAWKPLGSPYLSATPLQRLSIAADPTNSQVIYTASGSSVCKSMDGGHQFHCITITFASSQTNISSLVVDPQQPQTVYASAAYSGGVFKSLDGGETWGDASQGLPEPRFIDSVTIDPFHPNVLYAWAGRGGYVSTNSGGSWSPSGMPWPQDTSVGGLHFSFDPVTPGILYGPRFANNQVGIQKSRDGGATWTQLNTPFSSCCVVPDPKVSGVIYALAFFSTTSNNHLCFAEGFAPCPFKFWKSSDGGANWTSYQLPRATLGPLVVDPANPEIMLAGEFLSTDGGQTWRPTNVSRDIQPVFAPSSAGLAYAIAPNTSDAFLAKFLPDGKTLIFSTYFGGMGNDLGQGIALDSSGNIWVTGSTSSYDLPVTPGTFQKTLNGGTNAFVAKFSNDGELLAATYLGGSSNDAGLGIAMGAQGNPWLIGSWTSTDFPFTTAPPATLPFPAVGFLIEFDPDVARLLHSSNVGGTFDVNGKGIAIDSSGNITLAGSTYGSFPITPGAFHAGDAGLYSPKAFVLKLAPSGQVIYSTFFGGTQAAQTPDAYENEHDYGVAVAVDAGGNAYVTGYTSAKDFPITPGVYQTSLAGGCSYPAFTITTGFAGAILDWFVDDVFVVKLSPDGKTVLFSTLLGGSCYDHPTSIALDGYSQVYITGETDSTDFPLVSDLEPGPPIREFVSFLSVFNPAASALMFSTYLYAGATPTVVTGPGSLILVAGSTGLGAQSQADTGVFNPFPATATDGNLVLIKPARLRRRYRPLSDSGSQERAMRSASGLVDVTEPRRP